MIFSSHLLAHAAEAFPSALVNLCGATGVTLGCVWPFLAGRRAILLCQSLGAAAFGLHFLLLGSATGAVMCTVSLVQALAAAGIVRRASLVVIFAATIAVAAYSTWATWHGIPSVCATVGLLFATLGRLMRDGQRMRCAFFGSSTAWVGHNLLMGSAFGLTCDSLSLTSIAVGLWKHRRSGTMTAYGDAEACLPRLPDPANDRALDRQRRRRAA